MHYLYRNYPVLAKGVEESRSLDSSPAASLLEMTKRGTRTLVVPILTALLLGGFSAAQMRDRTHPDPPQAPDSGQAIAKKPKNYPRAIAVIEFLPGGKARLVPVALWIDDQFYDASLYGANPAPMAVQPETVYEATDYGEPVGLFTVTTPEQIKGNWIATGSWKPRLAMDDKMAQRKAAQPKPKPPEDAEDSGRPTLHRAASSGSSDSSGAKTSGSNSGSTPSAAEDDPNRPTLKESPSSNNGSATTTAASGSKAGQNSSAASNSGGTPAAAEDDPNRPVLKRPADENNSASTASASSASSGQSSASAQPYNWNGKSPDESDPNRPVLRRGKPETAAAAAPPTDKFSSSTQAISAAQAKLMASMTVAGKRSFPAVSDAGPWQTRSMLYAMNPMERANKEDALRKLALAEIRKFIASRHTAAIPKDAYIHDYDLRAFDLDYSNSPTLVLTATLPVESAKAFRGGEFDYFVTFVAREDINGDPIKIFSSVTDSNHLDAFPRMETVGAVNADANGRGDLLFRQYSDTGVNYSLYRVFPYNMEKIFEGGAGV